MNEDRSRQRLGRGLAALIGGGIASAPPRGSPGFASVADAPPEGSGERRIALGALSPNPRNPRRHFGEAELADLTASVKAHGVVQPILVRLMPGTRDAYEIVAGERRFRAAKAAGLSDVPVVVREISDRQSLEIAIIENVQRADLSAIEEAEAYQSLIEEHGYTQADLADVLGKSRSHVANTLRLLKLPASVRAMVAGGELSPGHARTAVSAEDPEAFARAIVERGLSVREAEEMARRGSATPDALAEAPAPAGSAVPERAKAPRSASPDPAAAPSAAPKAADDETEADTRALERLLSETLGMPVDIRLPEAGGDVRIGYGTLERLDALCRLLQTRHAERSEERSAEPRVRSL